MLPTSTNLCITLSFLVILTVIVQLVENKLVMKMNGMNCTSLDTKLVEFPICGAKAISRNTIEVSMYAKLHKTITGAVFKTKIMKRGYEHLRPLYELTTDLCEFFKTKRPNPIASALYLLFGFAHYSNVNHTCPYNHDLILDRYIINNTNIQLLPIPAGSFVVTSNVYVQRRHSVVFVAYLQISEK